MKTLTILYDANCRLCCRIKEWLQAQLKYVDLDFIAAGSEAARRCYPQLDHEATLKELTVVCTDRKVLKSVPRAVASGLRSSGLLAEARSLPLAVLTRARKVRY